jgi:hypothetical protein
VGKVMASKSSYSRKHPSSHAMDSAIVVVIPQIGDLQHHLADRRVLSGVEIIADRLAYCTQNLLIPVLRIESTSARPCQQANFLSPFVEPLR